MQLALGSGVRYAWWISGEHYRVLGACCKTSGKECGHQASSMSRERSSRDSPGLKHTRKGYFMAWRMRKLAGLKVLGGGEDRVV
jgi:hypothetical protein